MSNPNFAALIQKVILNAMSVRWSTIGFLFALHFFGSAAAFLWFDETAITDTAINYLYFWVTTASTIGYGDISPATQPGRLFSAVIFQPAATALFLLLVGKIGAQLYTIREIIMKGLGNYAKKEGHVVLVGFQKNKTIQLIEESYRGLEGRDIIVVSDAENDERLPRDIHIVRTGSLSNQADLARAGISKAERIVVMTADDNETLSASLAVMALKPQGHVVAYFEMPTKAHLLEQHCPEVECVISTSVEQVSRALTDPGSSKVFSDLASSQTEYTMQSVVLTEDDGVVNLEEANILLKYAHANLVGFRRMGSEEIIFHISDDTQLFPEDVIYYIAKHRLQGLPVREEEAA